ncbi:MAG: hypothetical protein M1825_005872 [Sarcosagium campestre]|nr:MAG: hypothetical protein M1825_005872 [Sarcosagium campestre]
MSELTHDEGSPDLHPVSTVHAFPEGYFLENLAVRSNGDILVTVFSHNELYNISPTKGPDSPTTLVHTFAGAVSGIVEVGTDTFYVSSGTLGSPGSFSIWKVSMTDWDAETTSAAGVVSKLIDIPDAPFLNGSTLLSHGAAAFLCVDSILGVIYRVDVDAKPPKSSVWFKDDQLVKKTENPMMPGANGLQLFNGHVYVSNTETRKLFRIAVDDSDGAGDALSAKGPLELVLADCLIDDFTFAVDGTAFLTAHIYNTVVRVAPSGGIRNVVAGGPEDAIVAGSTACAFGRRPSDRDALYVTTNGGMSAPVGGKLGPGRLLKVDVGVVGA